MIHEFGKVSRAPIPRTLRDLRALMRPGSSCKVPVKLVGAPKSLGVLGFRA